MMAPDGHCGRMVGYSSPTLAAEKNRKQGARGRFGIVLFQVPKSEGPGAPGFPTIVFICHASTLQLLVSLRVVVNRRQTGSNANLNLNGSRRSFTSFRMTVQFCGWGNCRILCFTKSARVSLLLSHPFAKCANGWGTGLGWDWEIEGHGARACCPRPGCFMR